MTTTTTAATTATATATATGPRAIPGLGEPRSPRRPRVSSRTLPNGLRAFAIRRDSVPLAEVRVRIPAAVATSAMLSRSTLLAETMLKGTRSAGAVELEESIGLLGGQLLVASDRDKAMVGGSVLVENLSGYLAILADVLTSATYPTADVEQERGRLTERLAVANSNPGTIAAKAIAAELFGSHPYAHVLPEPDELAATSPASVRSWHRRCIRPEDAIVVIVGALPPAKALDLLESALGEWTGTATPSSLPEPSYAAPSGIALVDRPGSVQSAIRLGVPALPRTDQAFAALSVANMLLGGYFSSRLVANLREDKGYTYTPRSGIDLAQAASVLTISADVSTEVTAAALNETLYEVGRIAFTLPDADELENARQYLIGSRVLALSTQSGLASSLANLEFAGVGLDWLWDHQRALAKVSADDVQQVAARIITPQQCRIAVVGDASLIEGSLGALRAVRTAS